MSFSDDADDGVIIFEECIEAEGDLLVKVFLFEEESFLRDGGESDGEGDIGGGCSCGKGTSPDELEDLFCFFCVLGGVSDEGDFCVVDNALHDLVAARDEGVSDVDGGEYEDDEEDDEVEFCLDVGVEGGHG